MPKRPGYPITQVLREFYDSWQGGISGEYWIKTAPATGTNWAVGVNNTQLTTRVVPNANETSRLVGVHRWTIPSIASGTITDGSNVKIKKLCMEFPLYFSSIAFTLTTSFFGFTTAQTGIRTTNDIIGWGFLSGRVLTALGDLSGTETVSSLTFSETLTQWNKFKLEISILSGVAIATFWLNENIVFTFGSTYIPTGALYPNFYFATDATGARTLDIGPVHIWQEGLIIP